VARIAHERGLVEVLFIDVPSSMISSIRDLEPVRFMHEQQHAAAGDKQAGQRGLAAVRQSGRESRRP